MRRLAIVLLISVFAAARGHATDYATMGAGTSSCGEFRSARTAPETAAYFNWALGFMSGLNTSRLASGWVTKNMGSISVEEQQIAIATYCNDHPLGSFNEAVMDVYFRLQNSDYRASRVPTATTSASQQ
ncbi:MAG: hypothetical protein WAK55_20885 [Xanthobacteraceae bacterium]